MLIHDEPVHGRALRAVAAEAGVRVTRRDYEEKYMVGDDAFALSAVLRDAGLRPGRPGTITSLASLVRRKRRIYRELIGSRLRLNPGAARLLRAICGKIPVGIVSAAAGAEIRAALRASGLTGRIGTIVSAESVHRSKPHPEPYREALRRLGLRAGPRPGRPKGTGTTSGTGTGTGSGTGPGAGAIVTFEDTPGGIASALAAGIDAIAVATSYNPTRLRRAGARAVVPDLGSVDAGALLEGRWGSLRRRPSRPSKERSG